MDEIDFKDCPIGGRFMKEFKENKKLLEQNKGVTY